MRKSSPRGFSLVEAIIIGAAVTAAGLILMSIQKNLTNVIKDTEASSEVVELEQEIKRLLINTENCTHSFKDLEISSEERPFIVKRLQEGEFKNIYYSEMEFPSRGINLDKLTYQESEEGEMKIKLLMTKRYIKRQVIKDFVLDIYKDEDGKIKGCGVQNDESSNVKCKMLKKSCNTSDMGTEEVCVLESTEDNYIFLSSSCYFEKNEGDVCVIDNIAVVERPIIKTHPSEKSISCSVPYFRCFRNDSKTHVDMFATQGKGILHMEGLACRGMIH